MKKNVLFLIMLLLIGPVQIFANNYSDIIALLKKSETNNYQSIWEVYNFIDDFGDSTAQKYITNNNEVFCIYNNNKILNPEIIISNSLFCFSIKGDKDYIIKLLNPYNKIGLTIREYDKETLKQTKTSKVFKCKKNGKYIIFSEEAFLYFAKAITSGNDTKALIKSGDSIFLINIPYYNNIQKIVTEHF